MFRKLTLCLALFAILALVPAEKAEACSITFGCTVSMGCLACVGTVQFAFCEQGFPFGYCSCTQRCDIGGCSAGQYCSWVVWP